MNPHDIYPRKFNGPRHTFLHPSQRDFLNRLSLAIYDRLSYQLVFRQVEKSCRTDLMEYSCGIHPNEHGIATRLSLSIYFTAPVPEVEEMLCLIPEIFPELTNLHLTYHHWDSLPDSFKALAHLDKLVFSGSIKDRFKFLTPAQTDFAKAVEAIFWKEFPAQTNHTCQIRPDRNGITARLTIRAKFENPSPAFEDLLLTIPTVFPQFVSLTLSYNHWTSLPLTFNRLHDLQELSLYGPNFTHFLPNFFSPLVHLRTLYLYKTRFPSEAALTPSFYDLPHFTELHLHENASLYPWVPLRLRRRMKHKFSVKGPHGIYKHFRVCQDDPDALLARLLADPTNYDTLTLQEIALLRKYLLPEQEQRLRLTLPADHTALRFLKRIIGTTEKLALIL